MINDHIRNYLKIPYVRPLEVVLRRNFQVFFLSQSVSCLKVFSNILLQFCFKAHADIVIAAIFISQSMLLYF